MWDLSSPTRDGTQNPYSGSLESSPLDCPVIIILMFKLTRFCLRCPFKLASVSFWHVFPTLWKKSYDQPRQHIKKQRHYFANKGVSSHGYGFSSSHVWMWELDYKESWVTKNWWFWTVVLEKTLEHPLDSKEIQPVHLKEISPEYSLEGLMKLKLNTPVFLPGESHGWRSLVGYSPRGREESDTTEWLHSLTLVFTSTLRCNTVRTVKVGMDQFLLNLVWKSLFQNGPEK